MDDENENEVFCINPEEHNSYVMRGFQDQLIDGKNCDLEIRLQDSNLFVHKCLVDIFFTKIGADLEDDRFYLDLTQFPKKLMTPLVDMMYHGVLSVPKDDIPDLGLISSHVGYTQAKEVLAPYLQEVEKNRATVTEAFPGQSSNANGFVIKSEPPDDELGEFGLINQPGYIAENAFGDYYTRTAKNTTDSEEPKHIYEVFTPNPESLEKNVQEITSNLKFKEDIARLTDLIRDKDKTRVTITENPYEVVSKIQKQNELIIPQGISVQHSAGRAVAGKLGRVEVKRRRGPYNTRKEKEEMDFGSQIMKKKTDRTSRLYSLQRKVDQYIASRSVGVSVTHVQSPGPKANRSTFDGTNEKNFEKAAANRMLQNSIMSALASKAKMKPVPGGMIKELTVKARLKDNDEKPTGNEAPEKSAKKVNVLPQKKEVVERKRPKFVTLKEDMKHLESELKDNDEKTTDNEAPQNSLKKINVLLQKKEVVERKRPKFVTKKEDMKHLESELKDNDAKMTGYKAQPKTVKKNDVQLQEKKVMRRKRTLELVNYLEETDHSDSEDEEREIGDYLLKKRRTKVKYFPPAGIVPEGCKSSYAQSCFTKTKTITETLTTGNSDVMVIRKEVPIRHTIYNPKKAEPGVAAVVVCHPTKPVVRY